jgi:hypothetical protein
MVRGCNTVACRQAAERRRTDAVRAAALGAGAVCAPAHLHEPASNQLQYSFCVFNAAPDRYWNDPFKHSEYLQRNVFLPNLNNELAVKSKCSPGACRTSPLKLSQLIPPPPSPSLPLPSVYKQRLLSLKSLVLVMFTRDSMARRPQLTPLLPTKNNAPSPYQKQRPP